MAIQPIKSGGSVLSSPGFSTLFGALTGGAGGAALGALKGSGAPIGKLAGTANTVNNFLSSGPTNKPGLNYSQDDAMGRRFNLGVLGDDPMNKAGIDAMGAESPFLQYSKALQYGAKNGY